MCGFPFPSKLGLDGVGVLKGKVFLIATCPNLFGYLPATRCDTFSFKCGKSLHQGPVTLPNRGT